MEITGRADRLFTRAEFMEAFLRIAVQKYPLYAPDKALENVF